MVVVLFLSFFFNRGHPIPSYPCSNHALPSTSHSNIVTPVLLYPILQHQISVSSGQWSHRRRLEQNLLQNLPCITSVYCTLNASCFSTLSRPSSLSSWVYFGCTNMIYLSSHKICVSPTSLNIIWLTLHIPIISVTLTTIKSPETQKEFCDIFSSNKASRLHHFGCMTRHWAFQVYPLSQEETQAMNDSSLWRKMEGPYTMYRLPRPNPDHHKILISIASMPIATARSQSIANLDLRSAYHLVCICIGINQNSVLSTTSGHNIYQVMLYELSSAPPVDSTMCSMTCWKNLYRWHLEVRPNLSNRLNELKSSNCVKACAHTQIRSLQ